MRSRAAFSCARAENDKERAISKVYISNKPWCFKPWMCVVTWYCLLQALVIEGRRPSRKPLYKSRYASNTALWNMYGYRSNKMSTGMLPMDDDADCNILLFSQWNISGSHLGTQPAHTTIVAPGQCKACDKNMH